MASKNFENGIVGTDEGGSTDLSSDLMTTGDIYWLDSASGNDANAGTNRTAPLATLAQAITNATANNGDIIVIEEGHAETLSGAVTVDKAGVRIMGLGAGTTKPAFTVAAAVDGISITAARVEIHNVRFSVGTTATNTSRINVGAAGCRIVDCDFLCGQYDLESITVPDAGDDLEVNGCTFTVSADGPDAGIEVEAAAVLGLKVIGCTFDGGDYDFDVAGLNSGVAHTEFLYRDNVLVNKASIIHTDAAKGQCIGTVAGDGSRIEI